MSKKVDDAVARVVRTIDSEAAPGVMSVDESREFYESVSSWIDGALDGLDDDAQNTKEDEDDGA